MSDTAAPAPATPAAVANVSAPGVSDIALPADAASAEIARQQLLQDPDFMKRVEAKEPNAFAHYNRLWRLSRGMTAELLPPHSPVDVQTEIDARLAAQIEQHATVYADKGYTAEQATTILGQRPLLASEKQWHQVEYNNKRSDPEFMRRWMAGDQTAIRQMNTHAIALRLPTGTLEDIQRWENG